MYADYSPWTDSHANRMLACVAKNPILVAFGRALKKIRQRQGLSQETLAHEAGLDRTFISLLERGQRQPTLTTLFALSTALNIKPTKLISDVEKTL